MSCLMKRSPYTPLLKENYRRRIRMCKANMHRKKQKESRMLLQITWLKMFFVKHTLASECNLKVWPQKKAYSAGYSFISFRQQQWKGTTFRSCGKDVIKITRYGADFYPVEVNLVALPFGMYIQLASALHFLHMFVKITSIYGGM